MSSSAIALARTWISRLAAKKNFDSLLMTVEPVGGEIGNIVFEMKVEPKHANAFDTLHGGAAAYLVDALSSVSQLTLDRPPGVSVELQLRYLRAAKVGKTILIETETQKSGKNLLFSNVLIKDKETGQLLVHGTHTKYTGS